MYLADILGALRRQWIILLVGLPVCVLVAWTLAHPAPTYTVRSEVQFLPPSIDALPNALSGGTQSLVVVAGLIALDVTPPTADPLTTTSDVDLTGLGVRHGSSVIQTNFGGQWAYNFASASLIIQSVASTPEGAAAQHRRSLSQVEGSLKTREDAAGVSPEQRIRLRAFPVNPPVEAHVGHRRVAILLALYACIAPLLALVVLVDRMRTRSRHPRKGSGGHGTGAPPQSGDRRSSHSRTAPV